MKIRFGVLFIVTFLLCGFTIPNQETIAHIFFDPELLSVNPNDIGETSVAIASAKNVYGIEIHATFDPNMIQIVDTDPSLEGVQVSPGDALPYEEGFLVRNQVDNQFGSILYGFTLLNPATPFSGDGNLITIDLMAIGLGKTEITINKIIISSPDGVAMPFEVENLEIFSDESVEQDPGTAFRPTLPKNDDKATPMTDLLVVETQQITKSTNNEYLLSSTVLYLLPIVGLLLFFSFLYIRNKQQSS